MTPTYPPHRVIAALTAMEVSVPEGAQYKRITEEQGEEIARFMEGDHGLFRRLDERPGEFYAYGNPDEWHWKLRQARNGCTLFFEIMASDRLEKGAKQTF